MPDDGRAAKVVCPNIQKSAWLIEGAFVNVNQLCTVAAGAGRNQLCHLLGRPHSMEGFGLVREWDYIFNLHAGKGSEFVTCQYKMVFDENALAQSFHWAPTDCANQLTPKPLAVVEKLVTAPVVFAAPVGVGAPRRVSLSADALFAFDKSAPEHLQAIAHLFGLRAAPPQRARVLELGCAWGGNLVPFAARYPQAQAVGVDLSSVQIAEGRQNIERLGLINV